MDYKSKRWKHLREIILRRDGYMCQDSLRYGKHVPANTVHHVFPAEQFPEYQWQPWNLVSLSQAAHNEMHDRDTNELTSKGAELLRMTAIKYGIDIPARYDTTWHAGAIWKAKKLLVCGKPGTGKSTFASDYLGGGVAYDLDALAAAFRLKGPHEETHEASRRIANELYFGFAQNAENYSERVLVVRTAPTKEELEAFRPDCVVLLSTQRVPRTYAEYVPKRLREVEQWCKKNRVTFLKR